MVTLAGGQIDEAEDGLPKFLKIPSKLYRMDVSVIKDQATGGHWKVHTEEQCEEILTEEMLRTRECLPICSLDSADLVLHQGEETRPSSTERLAAAAAAAADTACTMRLALALPSLGAHRTRGSMKDCEHLSQSVPILDTSG